MLTEEEFNKEVFDRMMLIDEFVEFNIRASDKRVDIDLWIMSLLNYCFLRINNTEGEGSTSLKKMFLMTIKEACNKLEKEIGN